MTAHLKDGLLNPGAGTSVASPEALRQLAARFALASRPGDVFALYGELGAGKTEFVRGFAEALGVDAAVVTSPTFTLIHEYDGMMPIYHFDAYRIRSDAELIDMGLDEYLYDEGICLIEWPERIEHLLPRGSVRLRLEHGPGAARTVTRLT